MKTLFERIFSIVLALCVVYALIWIINYYRTALWTEISLESQMKTYLSGTPTTAVTDEDGHYVMPQGAAPYLQPISP